MVELQERRITPFDGLIARPAGDGFADLRTRALSAWQRQGVPTTKHEEWKYTSLRDLAEYVFHPADGVVDEDLSSWVYDPNAIRLTFVDGTFCSELSSDLASVEGLAAVPSSDAAVGSLVDIETNPFAALNTALFEEAFLIDIAKDALIDRPIELLFVATAGPNPTASFPRLVIRAGQGCQATLTETYVTIGEGVTLQCPVIEVFVAENAMFEHVRAQLESEMAFHVGLTQVKQERDSTYRHFSVTYGGALTRNDTNVFLNGSNLHCRLDGVYAQTGEQVCDNHTRLDHAYPHCDSFEVYKGILDGKARGVFNGKIYVHQDAQKTDAKQTNQAILLSPTASIDTKPQLEIYADDVKCTHGATVGQLREDAMFYLRSRGIPQNEARAILVYAFAAEVLEKIEATAVRTKLERLLFEKLND